MCPFSEVDDAADSKCIFFASDDSVSVAAGRFLMRLEEMVETALDVPKNLVRLLVFVSKS